MSIAIMVVQPLSLLAITALNPTAPQPNTARLEPGSGCIWLTTAPLPVELPQPSGASTFQGNIRGDLHFVAIVIYRILGK